MSMEVLVVSFLTSPFIYLVCKFIIDANSDYGYKVKNEQIDAEEDKKESSIW